MRYDRLAIASLVCGLLAYSFPVTRHLFATPPFFFTSPVAFVLGILALRRIKTQPERLKGRGMALAGIIIPSVAMVVGLIVLFIYLIDLILSGEKLLPF